MFWFKGCSKCGGDLHATQDMYGPYIACLQCGRQMTASPAAQIPVAMKETTLTQAHNRKKVKQLAA